MKPAFFVANLLLGSLLFVSITQAEPNPTGKMEQPMEQLGLPSGKYKLMPAPQSDGECPEGAVKWYDQGDKAVLGIGSTISFSDFNQREPATEAQGDDCRTITKTLLEKQKFTHVSREICDPDMEFERTKTISVSGQGFTLTIDVVDKKTKETIKHIQCAYEKPKA